MYQYQIRYTGSITSSVYANSSQFQSSKYNHLFTSASAAGATRRAPPNNGEESDSEDDDNSQAGINEDGDAGEGQADQLLAEGQAEQPPAQDQAEQPPAEGQAAQLPAEGQADQPQAEDGGQLPVSVQSSTVMDPSTYLKYGPYLVSGFHNFILNCL